MTQEETRAYKYPSKNHDIFAWTHSDMKGIHPSMPLTSLTSFQQPDPFDRRLDAFTRIDKIVVPKKEGKWRVCVDYTNLNNACPKDSFPLPRIDQIVDSTSGQGMLSFLDAFSGYHQIPMSPDDEEKTAFITPHGLYCYKVMPFGLKNAGATYQRLMTKIFKPLIGRSVEPKRHRSQPGSSQSSHGDTSSQEQKGVTTPHRQARCVRTFIARFTDELRPFFLAIRKAGTQGWTDNCQNALERIKHCLMHPPILSSPIPKEKLYVFSCLRMGNQRRSIPLPFTKGAETCLLCQQALADVETSILHKPDLTGRMLQWAIELSEFGIEFQPRLSKKGQVMADFVLEYSRRPNQHHESSEQEWWTLRVDGASRSSGSGVGLLLQSPTGEHLEQAIRLGFSASNNEAEYEAILSGLDLPCAIRLQTPDLQRLATSGTLTLGRYSCFPPIREAILLPIHVQANPSVAENSTCNTIEQPTDDQEWTHDIAEYLRTGTLPEDPKQAHKIRVQAARFTLIGGTCTSDPSQGLIFAVLGIQRPKAEAYASIKDKDVTKFVWKNIVCRFGIPQIIIADNGPQFDSIAFRNFCSELNIRNSYSTPRYPQSNGQAEATNKTLINALKKRLEQAKGKWVEELPGVLWAYRTTPGRPTGNTPFALTYGMDAVIPTEIGLPTIRTDAAKQKDANTELGRNLDWADEVRESASIRMADYQQRASAHYNRKVRPRNFKNGTLVLRKVFENTAEVGAGNSKPIGKDPT
ncbi:Transposon Ty3-I Gag-Pol polyprotein [Vitis vinifera]|uniref:Transposon Ty3-I Gag-Pol polyprotein n=1 Tax=Vitis vinifera TaxID=29760 RepID=A0A438GS58_VITVI|nr:Transposon Ty3-I Gag-Pol polyprotein [Vitis vinifera]